MPLTSQGLGDSSAAVQFKQDAAKTVNGFYKGRLVCRIRRRGKKAAKDGESGPPHKKMFQVCTCFRNRKRKASSSKVSSKLKAVVKAKAKDFAESKAKAQAKTKTLPKAKSEPRPKAASRPKAKARAALSSEDDVTHPSSVKRYALERYTKAGGANFLIKAVEQVFTII